MKIIGSYPEIRLRRNRKSDWSRRLVRENTLSASDLIWPIFIREGKNIKEPIKSMPGVYRYSLDKIEKLVERAIINKIPMVAAAYRNAGASSIIIGDENYGEGSSREHAAMEPRFVGVKAVLVKSFPRIHETNLKKQGVLALTFNTKTDYDKIQEDDQFDIKGLTDFQPGKSLLLIAHHFDETSDEIIVNHPYNQKQIDWFRAGSALNSISHTNNSAK